MKLRTFTAESMPAALAQVKQALGSDAVILHTRSYKRGGFFGLGAKTVVEITAARGSEVGQRRERQQRQRRAEQTQRLTAGKVRDSVAVSDDARSRAEQMSAGDLIRKTYLAAQAELRSREVTQPAQPIQQPQPQPIPAGAPSIGAPNTVPVTTPSGNFAYPSPDVAAHAAVADTNRASAAGADDLAHELAAVKRMVAKMVRQQRQRDATPARGNRGKASTTKSAPQTDLPDKLFDQYLGLLQQEVTEELAEEIVQQVRASLSTQDMEDETKVREAITSAVVQLVPVDDSASADTKTDDGRPRTIALIGPTGVGKTTTIAKLAANFKLREKKKVALITIDTYRIAAVDQLRTYASIIGVPLQVISQPSEMADAIKKCAGCDVVLIDTAGRSQRDDPKLSQLNEYVQAADAHEVHLVLSSTCTHSVLMDAVERFNRIRVDKIIFTKLDEAVTFGVLLNVTRKVNKRLSYFTTGQEVPHHIEPGRSDRLAALVLGEGL